MSTTFNSLRPILWTKKFEETVTFYRNILGFDLAEVNMEYQWAALIKDGVELMISAPNLEESTMSLSMLVFMRHMIMMMKPIIKTITYTSCSRLEWSMNKVS